MVHCVNFGQHAGLYEQLYRTVHGLQTKRYCDSVPLGQAIAEAFGQWCAGKASPKPKYNAPLH